MGNFQRRRKRISSKAAFQFFLLFREQGGTYLFHNQDIVIILVTCLRMSYIIAATNQWVSCSCFGR